MGEMARRHLIYDTEPEEVQLNILTAVILWLARISPVVSETDVDIPNCVIARWKGTGYVPLKALIWSRRKSAC